MKRAATAGTEEAEEHHIVEEAVTEVTEVERVVGVESVIAAAGILLLVVVAVVYEVSHSCRTMHS